MRNILIQGVESFLGSNFAARWLQNFDATIFYSPDSTNPFSEEEIIHLVFQAACNMSAGTPSAEARQRIAERLRRVDGNLSRRVATDIEEVWCFAGPTISHTQVEMRNSLISACSAIGAKRLNYVEADAIGGDSESEARGHEISQRAKAQDLERRIFLTSLVVGAPHPGLEQSGAVFLRFLSLLHSFKAEIEERSAQYFDFQALRCVAPANAALNLITADTASDLLVRIAQEEGTAGANFSIVSPQNTPFAVLCERIGIAYGIGLLPVENFESLNAIDRSFDERLEHFHSYFKRGAPPSPSADAYQAAKLPPENALLDEEAQITLFESIRRRQDDALTAWKERIAELPGKLLHKTIVRGGSELNYYVAGPTGTPVVVLNALGQGVEYWYRLVDRLMEHHRVLIWEPRGTVSPPPPFGLGEQVNDVDAVLQHEGIDACHLIGWCTGPKVAIDFYLRRPSVVRSMAFLNGTFKCDGGPEELDSPYEQNLESLCRMLVRKPSMAASVMKTFQSRTEESEVEMLEGPDAEQRSIAVLSLMNEKLKNHVLAPFRTEQTTLNYAHQLVDFWSHDARPKTSEVKVPVLLMGTEYDQVATPEASAAAATLFPNARHVHVRGATHYCLYDRPEFVADLLKRFFANPHELAAIQCAPGAASCTQATTDQLEQSAPAVNAEPATAAAHFSR